MMMIDKMINLIMRKFQVLCLILFVGIFSCGTPTRNEPLFLPQGFEASVFVDSIAETVRH